MLSQPRSTQRHRCIAAPDEDALTRAIVTLAGRFGRYGYRRVTALLRRAGWRVNHKRVERIWRREGLRVPQKQPKRGRLWLNDGSCVRLRPCSPNHVWAYDFVQARTHDGRAFRLLTVIDEYTRECLAIQVARQIRSDDVVQLLADLFVLRGPPEHLRSDNGPEFCAQALREWLGRIGVKTLYTGISFIALRRLQVYIRLPQSSPPSTVFLPEGPTGSQPPFYESQKLIAWASRTSFFRYLSIPVGYRNHFLGCRRLGYPEGSDSPSIRPSMLANSRRLRWLSANNNQ